MNVRSIVVPAGERQRFEAHGYRFVRRARAGLHHQGPQVLLEWRGEGEAPDPDRKTCGAGCGCSACQHRVRIHCSVELLTLPTYLRAQVGREAVGLSLGLPLKEAAR